MWNHFRTNGSFQSHPRNSWSLFALILLSLIFWWKSYRHYRGFPRKTHDLNNNGMIVISFDLNSVFKTIGRESSLQTWPWQTHRIFSPEYFCPTGHFARKIFKISETEKLCSPPRLVRRWKCSLKTITCTISNFTLLYSFTISSS